MTDSPAIKTRSSGLATAALITGLLSFLCAPVGPIAIALGIAALVSIGRDPSRTGKGSATAGMLCGLAGTFILGVSSFIVFSAMNAMHGYEQDKLLKLTGVVDHVVGTYPNAQVLVIRDTYDPEKTQEIDAQLARLPQVTTYVRSNGEYGLDMIDSAEFDSIIAEHPDVTHVFMLESLPLAASEFAYFTDDRESRPKLVLYDSQLWGLAPYLSEDYIVAAALNQRSPDYDEDAPVPADTTEAFNLRYLLVTPENAEAVITSYPEFFGNDYEVYDDNDYDDDNGGEAIPATSDTAAADSASDAPADPASDGGDAADETR